MSKQIILTVLFFSWFLSSVFAQNKVPNFVSADYRSIEIKAGKGLALPQVLHLNLLYQRNIIKRLATVAYTEFGVKVASGSAKRDYLTINNFHWVEAIGIGGTFGKGAINNSFFVLAGGRYYRSKVLVQEELSQTLLTQAFLPELSLLYDLKWGKKKFYVATQAYIPLYPFEMFRNLETAITLNVGIGYKFSRR